MVENVPPRGMQKNGLLKALDELNTIHILLEILEVAAHSTVVNGFRANLYQTICVTIRSSLIICTGLNYS